MDLVNSLVCHYQYIEKLREKYHFYKHQDEDGVLLKNLFTIIQVGLDEFKLNVEELAELENSLQYIQNPEEIRIKKMIVSQTKYINQRHNLYLHQVAFLDCNE